MIVEAVKHEVQSLTRLDLEGLRSAWRARYGPAPKLRSPELVRLALAYRIQSDSSGSLDPATRRRLRTGVGIGQRDNIAAGVRIAREWRGRTFDIERVEGGYRWNGEVYASLSKLARAITGTKRNGPKFFGLRDEGTG
jgi:hypothetical protein